MAASIRRYRGSEALDMDSGSAEKMRESIEIFRKYEWIYFCGLGRIHSGSPNEREIWSEECIKIILFFPLKQHA